MRFKNFIKEDLELLNPLHFILSTQAPYFVVSPKQFDKEITVKNKVAFHITSSQNAITLSKLGKKKTISVLTKVDERAIFGEGIASGIGLVKLKGDFVAQFPKDIFSETDNIGRRWIPIRNNDLVPLLEKPLNDFRKKLYDKYLTGYAKDYNEMLGDDPDTTYDRFIGYDTTEFINWLMEDVLPADAKRKMIQEYYDFCSKMLRTSKLRDFFKTYWASYHAKHEYDEVLMNNIKILKGWVIFSGGNEWEPLPKKDIEQQTKNYKKAGLSDKDIIVVPSNDLTYRQLEDMVNKEGGRS